MNSMNLVLEEGVDDSRDDTASSLGLKSHDTSDESKDDVLRNVVGVDNNVNDVKEGTNVLRAAGSSQEEFSSNVESVNSFTVFFGQADHGGHGGNLVEGTSSAGLDVSKELGNNVGEFLLSSLEVGALNNDRGNKGLDFSFNLGSSLEVARVGLSFFNNVVQEDTSISELVELRNACRSKGNDGEKDEQLGHLFKILNDYINQNWF